MLRAPVEREAAPTGDILTWRRPWQLLLGSSVD